MKYLRLMFGEDIFEGIIQLLFVGAGFAFLVLILVIAYV